MDTKDKRKKAVTLTVIITSLIALIIGVPVGIMYGLFYDPNAKIAKVEEGTNYHTIFADNVADSFNQVESNKLVAISASDDQISTALNFIKERQYDFSKYVTNVEYDFDNSYILFDFQIPLFKTRLIVDVNTYFDITEQNLVIQIKDFRIGRTKTMMPLAKRLSENENIMNALLSGFESMSLNMKYDEATMSFIYPLENIVYDFYETSIEDKSSLIAGIVAQSVVDGKSIISSEDHAIKASLDGYDKPNKHELSAYSKAWPIKDILNEYIKPMIEDKIFTTINDDLQNKMVRYLLLGYEGLGLEDQKTFKKLDLSKYGIKDVSEYKGIDETYLDNKVDLQKIVKDDIDKEIEDHVDDFEDGYTFSITLTEDDFCNSMLDSSLFFNGFCPSSLDGSNIHYGLIDNCYFDLVEDGLALVNHFNFDSHQIVHSGLFTNQEKNGDIYSYSLDETMFGNIETCKYADSSYEKLLQNNLINNDDLFTLNINKANSKTPSKGDYSLVFDFKKIIDETDLVKELDEKDLTYDTVLTIDEDNFTLEFVLKA